MEPRAAAAVPAPERRGPAGAVGRLYGVWDDLWNLEKRATFVVDRAGVIRHVEAGGPAIETNRVLEALERLARAK